MGVGPMLHRTYAVQALGRRLTPAALVDLASASGPPPWPAAASGRHHHPHPLGHLARTRGQWRVNQPGQGDEHVAGPATGTGALRLYPASPGSGQCPRQSEKHQMETTGDDHGE